jgi:hypothetical protein
MMLDRLSKNRPETVTVRSTLDESGLALAAVQITASQFDKESPDVIRSLPVTPVMTSC